MKYALACVAAAALLMFSASAQEKKPPDDTKIPAEASEKPNPVKPTPASLELGKKYFSSQCTMCHGQEGDGKGDLAVELGLKMRDYRQPDALKDFTDGDLFYILTNGRGKMPGQGTRMPDEQKWSLVNYVRSLGKAKPDTKPAEKQAKP